MLKVVPMYSRVQEGLKQAEPLRKLDPQELSAFKTKPPIEDFEIHLLNSAIKSRLNFVKPYELVTYVLWFLIYVLLFVYYWKKTYPKRINVLHRVEEIFLRILHYKSRSRRGGGIFWHNVSDWLRAKLMKVYKSKIIMLVLVVILSCPLIW